MKLLLFSLVLLSAVFGFLELSAKSVNADTPVWCGVLAPANSYSSTYDTASGGNSSCLEYGQDYDALTSLSGSSSQLKSEFISAMTAFQSGQEPQQVGAAFTENNLEQGKNDNSWIARIENPAVSLAVNTSYNDTDSQGNCYNTAYNPSSNQDVFFNESNCGPFTALTFTFDGAVVFAIKTDCGNQLGKLPGLPPAPPQAIGGNVYYSGTKKDIPGVPINKGFTSKSGGNPSSNQCNIASGSTKNVTSGGGGSYNYQYELSGEFCITVPSSFTVSGLGTYANPVITPAYIGTPNGQSPGICGLGSSISGSASSYDFQYAAGNSLNAYGQGSPPSNFGCIYNTLSQNNAAYSYNIAYTSFTAVYQAPTITAEASCSSGQINIEAWDRVNPDDKVTSANVTNSLNQGGRSTLAKSEGLSSGKYLFSYSISPWNGYSYETFKVTATDQGGTSSPPTIVTIPPCANFACPSTTPIFKEVEGEPFTPSTTISGSANFGAIGSLPKTTNGNYVISVNGINYSASYYTVNGAWPADNGSVNNGSNTPLIPGLPAGKYVIKWSFAYLLPAANGLPAVNIDSPVCAGSSSNPGQLTINQQPYLKVVGGDVIAGVQFSSASTITGSCSNEAQTNAGIYSSNYHQPSGDYVGGGTEQAALATALLNSHLPGGIAQFGSDNNLTNGSNPPNQLSFANTNSVINSNYYASSFSENYCTPDYFTRLSSAVDVDKTTTSATTNLLSSLLGVQPGSTYVVPPGSKAILVSNGNLYIDLNTSFGTNDIGLGPSTNIAKLPSLYIVDKGGNIYIENSVNQLAGVYVAEPNTARNSGGNIYDCTIGDTPSSAPNEDPFNNCTKELVVHGSFMAKNIVFQRTNGNVAGSSDGSQPSPPGSDSCSRPDANAAEWFCYSPLIWLANPYGPSTRPNIDSISAIPPTL